MKKNVIALSIDVEDWFTVRNMSGFLKRDDWNQQELRIRIGLDFILQELSKRNIKATFFILGWIAERCPQIVKDINMLGHEICSHGYSHTPIDLLDPLSFEDDLRKSLVSIRNITGKKVKGFRAPSFSITKKTIWAIDILKKCGIEYDSSIFSIIHPDYGINNFPTSISNLKGLIEVPLKKNNFFGIKIPVCGGGYFRILPYWLIKLFISSTLKDNTLVMYFHPWEFDPEQPRVKLPLLKRFRHYVGLNRNKKKFVKLLDDFEFSTIENHISLEMERNDLPVISLKEFQIAASL